MSGSVQLPSTWVFAPLSGVSDINPRLFCTVPSAVAKPVHFVPMSAVTEEFGGIDVSTRRPLGDVQKGYTSFLANDVLFAKITPCMENGKLAVVPPLQDHLAFGSTEFHVLRAMDLVQPSWLAYFLSQSGFRRLARQNMTGSAGQLRVASTWLAEALIPVAPAAEQTRIVAKLEELLSDLDAGVAELKAAQKKLAQYRQALLKAAVEGALTADWRAAQRQHNTPRETGAQLLQRILTERRARWEARQLARFAEQGKNPPKDWQTKYPEPVQPDTSDLQELPEGWVWASAEQLCDFITKGTTPPKELDAGRERTIPFLRVTNLTDRGELDLFDKVFVSVQTHNGFLARSAVYPNDVLMNIVGPPLGQVAVVPSTFAEWNINQAIAIFRAVEGVMPGFVCRYLLSPSAQQWLRVRSRTTAGQTNLTLEVCRSLPFPLPPQEEQQALLLRLDEVMDATTHQSEAIKSSLKQSAAQRKNILRVAFSGQLVPQEPSDEPASVLLERIRAERAAHGGEGKQGRRAKGRR